MKTTGTFAFATAQEPELRTELEQIYRQHRQTLFSLALTVTGCTALAEDAVHEAFARLCRRQQPPSGDLVPYVFASVRNSARDRRKQEYREHALAESIYRDGTPRMNADPATDVEHPGDEEHAALRAAVQSLEESLRELVVLKIYGELTFEAISQILNIPVGTAATRYRKAIQLIEGQMRKNHEPQRH